MRLVRSGGRPGERSHSLIGVPVSAPAGRAEVRL